MDLSQLVLDSIPQLVFWKDRESVYRGCNCKFTRILHVDHPTEIVGKTDLELGWPVGQAEAARESDRRILESGEPESRIVERRDRDGRMRSFRVTKVPLRDEEENIVGILGSSEDITERREAREEIRRSRQNLQTLFDTLDDFLFVLAVDGRILQTNAIVRTRLGYDEEELLTRRIHDLHAPERAPEIDTQIAAAGSGRVILGSISLRSRGGTPIPVETKIARGQWGREPALFVVSRDVTERVRAEEDLRGAHRKHESRLESRRAELAEAHARLEAFRQFVEACDRGTGWIDRDGIVLYANPALAAMLGAEDAEGLPGTPLRDFYDEESARRIHEEAVPAATETGGWKGVLVVTPRHGDRFAVEHSLVVLHDTRGRPASFAVVIPEDPRAERS